MDTNKKMLIALGAGLAIGGILGILFAPDKGSETRKKIREGGNKFSEKVKEGLTKTKDKAESLKESLLQRIDSMEENMNEYI